MVREKRPEYAGTELFMQFYRTGKLEPLLEGHTEFFAAKTERYSFIDRLASASGGQHHIVSEFPGIEYELKQNVFHDPKQRDKVSINTISESVRTTFSGMKRYLADRVVGQPYCDVHYFGKDDKELLLIEEGPPRQTRLKADVPFIVPMPENALVAKRSERVAQILKLEDILRDVSAAYAQGAEYVGSCVKGRNDIRIIDTRDGRVYTATVSSCQAGNVAFTSGPIMYQVEVEYKGRIGAFAYALGQREKTSDYDKEEAIVRGVWDISAHIRRRIEHDKPVSYHLEMTDLTKFAFVKRVMEKSNSKKQANRVAELGLALPAQ